MPLTPEERSQRARIGAYATLAKHGRQHITAAARAANPSSDAYWLRKVDPAGALTAADRVQRAQDAKRAHFAALAFKSARARKMNAKRPSVITPTVASSAHSSSTDLAALAKERGDRV